MPPLKSLERDHPILDSNFCSFCSSLGILSVEDFLIHDIHAIVERARLQPDSERLKQGIDDILSILGSLHQPWRNGVELLEDARKNKQVLSTGCEEVDLLLRGGLKQGHVTEIAGPSSSGKTQFCLLAASNVAAKHMGQVVYVDTGNSFSPKRIASFVSQVDQRVAQNVLTRILCHSVYDIFDMFAVLHELENNMKSQMHGGDQLKLFVIDSISSLITPILGSSGSQGRALMTSAGFLLKKLAHEYSLAILVTNHTVGGEGGMFKPALGESWKIIPHVRLLLTRSYESSICCMSVLKHPSTASGKAAKFTTGE